MHHQGRYGVPCSIPQQPTAADADLWDAAARRAAGENDWEAARDLFAEAGQIAEKRWDIPALIYAHVHVQQCIRYGGGDVGECRRRIHEGTRLADQIGSEPHKHLMRFHLAEQLLDEGEYAHALRLFQECLKDFPGEDPWGLAHLLQLMGIAAAHLGSADVGVQVYTAALADRLRRAAPHLPSIHRRYEEKLVAASQSLTPEAYEAAKEAGRALTLEQAKVAAACLRS